MGMNKLNAAVLCSASAYNTALGAFPSVLTAAPISSSTTGIACVNTGEYNRLGIAIGGTDAENETLGYRIIGLVTTVDTAGTTVYKPVLIGEGAATLGAATMGAAGANIEATGAFWADTITDTAATSPYMTIQSNANDEIAEIIVDCSRFEYVYIQGSRNGQTAATFTFLTQKFNVAGGNTSIEDLTLTGTGLATAANQATGNTALSNQLAASSIADTNAQARQAIAATAATLAYDTAYKHWIVWSDASSANVSYRFTTAGTAATTSYPTLDDGDRLALSFDTAQKCSIIGASATGNVNYIAW